MWVIQVAGDENYDNSRLKAMLAPYMKKVEGVRKPCSNLIRLQWMMQSLRDFKPIQPAQLLDQLYMLEVAGDVVCTNAISHYRLSIQL